MRLAVQNELPELVAVRFAQRALLFGRVLLALQQQMRQSDELDHDAVGVEHGGERWTFAVRHKGDAHYAYAVAKIEILVFGHLGVLHPVRRDLQPVVQLLAARLDAGLLALLQQFGLKLFLKLRIEEVLERLPQRLVTHVVPQLHDLTVLVDLVQLLNLFEIDRLFVRLAMTAASAASSVGDLVDRELHLEQAGLRGDVNLEVLVLLQRGDRFVLQILQRVARMVLVDLATTLSRRFHVDLRPLEVDGSHAFAHQRVRADLTGGHVDRGLQHLLRRGEAFRDQFLGELQRLVVALVHVVSRVVVAQILAELLRSETEPTHQLNDSALLADRVHVLALRQFE